MKGRITGRLSAKLKRAETVVQETEETLALVRQDLDETRDILDTAEIALQEMYDYALEKKLLTQEDVDTLKSLRKRGLAKKDSK